MALVIKTAIDLYRYLFTELADPRVSDYLLAKSPIPALIILGIYLHFVLKSGPEFMKNRQPFKLDNVMIAYNIFQIGMNLYILKVGMKEALKQDIYCAPVNFSTDPGSMSLVTCSWLYHLTKLTDLLDTVFFVLRKKQSQVSFLHVYHHVGMIILSYMALKLLPGGHSVFIGLLNIIVHSVMYTYYLVTTLHSEYKKNLWWKKYITQLQLAQFFLVVLIYGQLLFKSDCKYPKIVSYFLVPQDIFMIILFADFYRKAYLKPEQKKQS